MKTISIICTVVVMGSLVAWAVSHYVEGRWCTRAWISLFLAWIVCLGIACIAGLTLVCTAVASLMACRERRWAVGALAAVLSATGLFWFCVNPAAIFLYGLRDHFAAQVGYPTMRQFAREILEDGSLTDAEGVLQRPGAFRVPTSAERKQWDELVARYPFLVRNGEPGTVVARGGPVELTWGSALTGHWGFKVSVARALPAPEKDRGRVLRVGDNIQFVSYYD